MHIKFFESLKKKHMNLKYIGFADLTCDNSTGWSEITLLELAWSHQYSSQFECKFNALCCHSLTKQMH